MFILVTISDTITILPKRFQKKLDKVLANEINIKYSNQVIPKIGLCIALKAIEDVGSPKYIAGTTGMHIKVKFRMIVFRPSVQEIISGKIYETSSKGIRVSLGFFEDVLIPENEMPHPSVFDEENEIWIWKYEGSDTELYLARGDRIRLRIRELEFGEPPRPGESLPKPPLQVIGTLAETTGLGKISWWK